MAAIYPQQFEGQPLVPKSTYAGAENDHAIYCAGHLVGRIMKSSLSGGTENWLWTLTGPCIPPELQLSQGRENTLAAAKSAFRAKFDAWRNWALEQVGPVPWHGRTPSENG